MKPVVFVLGPTAAGKSEFAMSAAKEFDGVILNCDSVQCYRGVDIGAAKPTAVEQREVRHYLLDWISPPNELTAARFSRKAHEVLKSEPKLVFAVGGSGFYLRALEKGVFDVMSVREDRKSYWSQKAAELGGPALHEELKTIDPDYAAKLSPNDAYRIARALMLIENENKTMTQIRKEFDLKPSTWAYRSIKIGFELSKPSLKDKITRRTRIMIEQGWREEVEKLLQLGLKDWAPLRSVGYREMVQFLEGEFPESELVPRIVQSTMKLAKKQMTWFKADPGIRWFTSEPGQSEALEYLRAVDLGNRNPE
jgi:tRNA dimethylallyltransferase